MRAIILVLVFMLTAPQLTSANTIKSTVRNSADLLAQLTTALIIQTSLEKNPLPIIQLAENLPAVTLLLPPSVYMFEKIANPMSVQVLKLLERKYPNISSSLKGPIARGTGLLSGAAGLTLLVEGLSGDLIKYFEAGWQGEIASFLAGMGLGFTASEATALLGGKAIATLGVSNPAGAATVGFVAGTAFFLTCEPVRNATHHFFKARKSKKQLQETIQYSLTVLKGLKDHKPGAFQLHLSNLVKAFEEYQADILFPLLHLEAQYLSRSIEIQQSYYKKIKLVEWIIGGSESDEIQSSGNLFRWSEEKLPLDLSIEVSLDRGNRIERLSRYLNGLKSELAIKLQQLELQYEAPRQQKLNSVLADQTLHETVVSQLEILKSLVQENFKSAPQLQEQLKQIGRSHQADYLTQTRFLADLQSQYAYSSDELSEEMVYRGDLLFESLNRTVEVYRRIRRKTYLKDLADKAQQLFVEVTNTQST